MRGDCQVLFCDGRGQAIARSDPSDTPRDDGNVCTDERCDGDAPGRAPSVVGTLCNGRGMCNGAGVCGACIPGTTRCRFDTLDTCGASGQWDPGTACQGNTPICSHSHGACVGVADLALGETSSCVRFADGSARCFGHDDGGILRNAHGRRRVLARGAEEIAVGLHHACARTALGTVACWGENTHGALGDGGQARRWCEMSPRPRFRRGKLG